jgi:lipid II:glycine glycyltransferase (peptidoglycan interpeptide bridge formation enzyme)
VDKFDEFYEMWKKANKIKHLWTPSEKNYMALVESFGDKCFCITSAQAGALILICDKIAYYYYAGALPGEKKLNLPYLVVWVCMQEAKKRGCNVWDFEGIYDPRWPNKSILGYTHFKQSFGGTEIEFPGSFTKWGW